jgi:AcrR family transcriptional regulator
MRSEVSLSTSHAHPPENEPVFTPDQLQEACGRMSFREGLEGLSARGELKAKLLRVALTHFAAKGYDGVQVREVAEEAGVSKPTLYYHFGSKEGLFRQLCLVALATTERRVQALVAPLLELPIPDAAAIESSAFELAKAYLDLLLEVPEFAGFILRSIAVPAPDSGFRDLMPLVERALGPLGLYIQRAFSIPLEKTREEVLVFTSLLGLLLEEKLRRPETSLGDTQLHWVVRRWLHGLSG